MSVYRCNDSSHGRSLVSECRSWPPPPLSFLILMTQSREAELAVTCCGLVHVGMRRRWLSCTASHAKICTTVFRWVQTSHGMELVIMP